MPRARNDHTASIPPSGESILIHQEQQRAPDTSFSETSSGLSYEIPAYKAVSTRNNHHVKPRQLSPAKSTALHRTKHHSHSKTIVFKRLQSQLGGTGSISHLLPQKRRQAPTHKKLPSP